MLAFQGMLLSAAEDAGMKVPPTTELDNTKNPFSKDQYPHFFIFCALQLGRRMEPNEPWENAKIIAAIPEAELKSMTLKDFLDKGLRYAT